MSTFGIQAGRPSLVLAPMEGVMDGVMRELFTESPGYGHAVSEFVRVSQNVLPAKVFRRMVPESHRGWRTRAGVPVQVQILGGNPERMAESAAIAVRAGAPGIDINFGCPAPTVTGNDGGSTILRFPDRLESIVRTIREAVPSEVPVSAKLRLGWDDPQAILHNIERVARGGASWITIHARTKEQGYRPPAHWEWIGQARRLVDVPVVANGEIWTLEEFRRARDVTGCEHFMIGRGALANPNLVGEIARELGIAVAPAPRLGWPAWFERLLVLDAELASCGRYHVKWPLTRMKQWLRFARMRFPAPWMDQALRAESVEAVLELARLAAGADAVNAGGDLAREPVVQGLRKVVTGGVAADAPEIQAL